MESDKVPPLVQYGRYSDAPARSQPYPYIRAQRMQAAGATNTKIVKHGKLADEDRECGRSDQQVFKAEQIAHSAKMLSAKSLQEARLIQSGFFSEPFPDTYTQMSYSDIQATSWAETSVPEHPSSRLTNQRSSLSPLKMARAMTTSAITRKSRVNTSKSAPHVSVVDPRCKSKPREESHLRRRVSWAFETPSVAKSVDISLSETKALLRSQIRMKEEQKVPPDFIYLAVNAIQSSMKPNETNINTAKNMREPSSKNPAKEKKGFRPSSSPSKIDPRTRVPIEELGLDNLRTHFDYESVGCVSDMEEVKSVRPTKDGPPKPVPPPDVEVYTTEFGINAVHSAPHFSTYGEKVPCSLPTGRMIRPQTSYLQRQVPPVSAELTSRPVTAIGLQRPGTQPSVTTALPGVGLPQKHTHLMSSSGNTNHTPMLMYPKEMQEKISQLKERRQRKQRSLSLPGKGNVSEFNGPLRNHVKFELKTHEQEEQMKNSINQAIQEKNAQEMEELEKKRKAVWLKKTKGQYHGFKGQKQLIV